MGKNNACATEPPTASSLYDLLFQTCWWRPDDRPLVLLREMSIAHKAHLIGWLERNAERLSLGFWRIQIRDAALMESHYGGDMPDGVFSAQSRIESDGSFALEHPYTWIRSLPIYLELLRQVRGGIGPDVDPPQMQRELEPAPEWEI